MTAVFGTPLAAILLAVELLLFELRPRSLLPVALACAVAGFLRPLWADARPAVRDADAAAGHASRCCRASSPGSRRGCCRTLMTERRCTRSRTLFGRLPLHWMWWPAIGGLVVGIGGYFEPRALGVGYDVIGDLLANHLALSVVVALVLVKAVIWVGGAGLGHVGRHPRAAADDRRRASAACSARGFPAATCGCGRWSAWRPRSAARCARR